MQNRNSVLLVDDDQGFLLMLTRQFQELGVTVTTAEDGLDALMLAAKDAPDLMILNVDLPGADGLLICEKLGKNEATKGAPVIFLTDRSDEETVHRCTALGAQYVYKDLRYWQTLRSMICEHLDVAPPPTDPADSPNDASGEGAENPAAPKILVIDDDPQVTRALAIRLGALGLSVIEAPNASGGTYLAWTERPDLIITDQNMPEMTGENLILKLKNDPETKNIPIIVITGQTVNGKEDFSLKRNMLGLRGAADYLTKPVDFTELVAVLRRYIRIPSPSAGRSESGPASMSQIRAKRG